MKNIILLITLFFTGYLYCQIKDNPTSQIIGLWQKDSKIVGSGLAQNFRFFSNGKFIFSLSSFEDARMLNSFKGKYRIEKESIIFTIKSKLIVDGNIVVGDFGFEPLFVIDGKIKEIPIKSPKEENIEIKILSNTEIKIGNEHYFKISNDSQYLISK